MPYAGINDPSLPQAVQDMPDDQRRRWIEVFNAVYEEQGEEAAFRIAYESVKRLYPDLKGTAVKRLDGKRIVGYGIVWGGRDLEGEYFTPDTDLWLDRIPPLKCLLFDHATTPLPNSVKQDTPAAYVIGKPDRFGFDEYGMWVESLLEEHEEWQKYVSDLVDAGVMSYSTDSISHLTARAEDGWIKSWPIPAISLTHHPAEPRAKISVMKRVHELNELKDILHAADAQDTLQAITQAVSSAVETTKGTPMTLKLNNKALVGAFVDAHLDQLKALALKAEDMPDEEEVDPSKGALESTMQPVAAQVAGLFGIPEEEAMQLLMAAFAERINVPSEDVIEEAAPVDEPMMAKGVTVNLTAFAEKLDTAKAGGKGGYMTGKNVQLQFKRETPRTLTAMIKAMVTKNHNAMKALGINPDTAGGYLVPTEQSNQVIELLRSKSLFLQGEANRLVTFFPMASDTLHIPKLAGGVTVSWIGENSQISDNTPSFGQITLVAKKMATLVKISNELLQDSDPQVDAIIREDIARAMANEVDRVVLEGSGVGSQPLGLANILDVTKTALNAAPTYDNLVDAVNRVLVADVEQDDTWAWVYHPRDLATIRKIEDPAGQYIWTGTDGLGRQLAGPNPDTILGYPYHMTTQIAIDTANNNETKLFFGRWRDVVIGMRKTIEIMASNEAGTSYEYDQTWIRAILRMDVNIRHAESIEVLTDVRTS